MYQGIPTKVLTGEVRLSYVHLEQKYANPKQPGAKEKYTCTLYIPKTDTATKADIDAAMQAAYEGAVSKMWDGARPQLKAALIYDGDGLRPNGGQFEEAAHGCWVITANSNHKPQVVDISNINVELSPEDVYSGMYARVTLNFFSFSGVNKGLGCGLGNVMKTRDGEPLGGGANAASDFAGVGQAAGGMATPQQPQAPYQQPVQQYQAPQQYQASQQPQAPYQQPVQQYQMPQPPQAAYAPGVTAPQPAPQTATPQINPLTGQPM
ncbi:MAG: DUF2815 family protein [Bilifractor sp.]